ncbi:hypothetical protein [Mycobacterium xenopi]|uniref:hypothetical protein n=1 Tax=Mycobacterium xenopi TaxID=1789 RepID=UPI000A15333F|nr:hypothetical protein [Mycobacterium xenopi]ORX14136.1 hypothetical protein AWC32_14230 [Mycobacterium xenopi]SPX94860.1 Uncharacterised protein [Mycobacterium xenopi]
MNKHSSLTVRRLRAWMRRVPARTRPGVVVALIALAGLFWQHHNHIEQHTTGPQHQAASPSTLPRADSGEFGDHPDVGQLPAPTVAPQAASMDAARAVAQRFATNFGSPNGNRDDWLARIEPEVSEQLMEQYRLTDIRNVNQAAVTSVAGPLDELPGAAAFRATYSDGSQIEIRLETAADGWKVVNVLPLSSQTAPSTPSAPASGGQ